MSRSRAVIRFKGWATIRLPTDPDPADEPRGASGYTFALAGEPDLDRVIRFQPQQEPEYLRSGVTEWDWGVTVYDALRVDADGTTEPIDGVAGAAVELLGGPKLENRNWLFTLPGWEPVYPFDLQIDVADCPLRRTAPLITDDPHKPLHEIPTPVLMAQGARGANLEPETVGTATGMWDAVAFVANRVKTLEMLQSGDPDPNEELRLEARLRELRYALQHPRDRRVMAHYAVERFSFPMSGSHATVPRRGPLAGLDPTVDWALSYFLADFDMDSFGMYVQGALQVPYGG